MFPFALLPFLLGLQLRPYVPPTLAPEPLPQPSEVSVIEVVPASGHWDANVFARPIYTAPLVGNVARGARLRVRGQVELPYAPYCNRSVYYALEPFGWLCADDAEPSSGPVTTTPVLSLVPGTPVPYRYVMVTVKEGSFVPMWASEADLMAHADHERELMRGDTIALDPERPTFEFEGERYYLSADGKVLPVEGTFELKNFSTWHGVELSEETHFPFGWITPRAAPVYDAPKGKKVGELARRTRVDIFEEDPPTPSWLKIGEGQYVKADHVNEVRKIARPEGTGQHRQWIDIDLGEQVVVAYLHERPVFATLTSSGRPPNTTPRGNYPVWGKATAITMKSQRYDDSPYYVNRVPWSLFFQAHNALHGAYWHDRFGSVKSHGCANLSPLDAAYLFDWLDPALPPGWTAVRYWNLNEAPVVHVRNSKLKKPFVQERNVGPPDLQEEAERLEQANRRRDQAALEEAARPAQPVVVTPLVTPVPNANSAIQGPLLPLAPLR